MPGDVEALGPFESRATVVQRRLRQRPRWTPARRARTREARSSSSRASMRASSSRSIIRSGAPEARSRLRSPPNVIASSARMSERSGPDGAAARSSSKPSLALSTWPASRRARAARNSHRRARKRPGTRCGEPRRAGGGECRPRGRDLGRLASSAATAGSTPSVARPRWRARSSTSLTAAASARWVSARWRGTACWVTTEAKSGARTGRAYPTCSITLPKRPRRGRARRRLARRAHRSERDRGRRACSVSSTARCRSTSAETLAEKAPRWREPAAAHRA